MFFTRQQTRGGHDKLLRLSRLRAPPSPASLMSNVARDTVTVKEDHEEQRRQDDHAIPACGRCDSEGLRPWPEHILSVAKIVNVLNPSWMTMTEMNFQQLHSAVTGNSTAFRRITRLLPAGGEGSKVFPPTYSGGIYAQEQRRLADGKVVATVLLDSVQSQANRMEQALLEARNSKKLKMPLIQVNFGTSLPDIGVITTLDAPHRIADAIFRDSLLGGKKFRDSDVGKAFIASNLRNATGLLQYCPHALLFGVWDSTSSEGGLGNKFQRALTSEIVGFQTEPGVHTFSRIDPLGITTAAEVYRTEEGPWTLNRDEAKKNAKGEPERARPSEFVHGNIVPTVEALKGGVTLDHAVQTSVLSLPALRRLRFPINGKETPEQNNAARTLLAALGLAAIAHSSEQGYDLRSRCLLVADGSAPFELISNDGKIESFDLDADAVDKLYADAVDKAKGLCLPCHDETIELVPEDKLIKAVTISREAKSGTED